MLASLFTGNIVSKEEMKDVLVAASILGLSPAATVVRSQWFVAPGEEVGSLQLPAISANSLGIASPEPRKA